MPEIFYRRRLPHWQTDAAVYFVTWRLADGQWPAGTYSGRARCRGRLAQVLRSGAISPVRVCCHERSRASAVFDSRRPFTRANHSFLEIVYGESATARTRARREDLATGVFRSGDAE